MHSSPELEPEDDMFPGEGPSTPHNPAAFSLNPASELSPPNSQGPARNDNSATSNGTPSMINANGKRAHPSAASAAAATAESSGEPSGVVRKDPVTGYKWTNPEDAPGYEWKSSRAREEEARAMDSIVDRSSQIKSASPRSS